MKYQVAGTGQVTYTKKQGLPDSGNGVALAASDDVFAGDAFGFSCSATSSLVHDCSRSRCTTAVVRARQ